jgi:hypothetical protein
VRGLDVHDLQRLGDAGVVDQHVDRAPAAQKLLHGGAAGRLVGDVAGETDMVLAQVACRLFRLLSVEVEDGDRGAMLGKKPRRGHAQAAGRSRPGHDSKFPIEKTHGLPSSCVGCWMGGGQRGAPLRASP